MKVNSFSRCRIFAMTCTHRTQRRCWSVDYWVHFLTTAQERDWKCLMNGGWNQSSQPVIDCCSADAVLVKCWSPSDSVADKVQRYFSLPATFCTVLWARRTPCKIRIKRTEQVTVWTGSSLTDYGTGPDSIVSRQLVAYVITIRRIEFYWRPHRSSGLL